MGRRPVAIERAPGLPRRTISRSGNTAQVLHGAMANIFPTFIVPLAIGAVAVVLALGLYNMLRGGSPNLSQKLMRWRVVLQFIAILIIMLTVWLMQQAGQ
jgi:hypothetical protein